MRITLVLDDLNRLVCSFEDGDPPAQAYAADPAAALTALSEALDALDQTGSAECFWLVSAGEFRWVLRRFENKARVAVLWCGSIVVGFQHVLWAEEEYDAFLSTMRRAIAEAPVPAL